MNVDNRSWTEQFQIQSTVDLDFVIGQQLGFPVGMERSSPPEFRRRVLAAAISYQLQLRSIDHALKRYVEPDLYDRDEISLGDSTSDYLRDSASFLEEELKKLHTVEDATFGVFGAELTLYKIPYAIDTARMLSNRGQLLEVLPILRLCLEMMCWANVAYHMQDEEEVVALKARNCISQMKGMYPTVGRLYGYLSRYSHWGHVIHGQFLDLRGEHVGILKASVRYRAMALALCLVIVDVFVEVIKPIYLDKSRGLVLRVQGVLDRSATRKTYQNLTKVVELSKLTDLQEIQSLLQWMNSGFTLPLRRSLFELFGSSPEGRGVGGGISVDIVEKFELRLEDGP